MNRRLTSRGKERRRQLMDFAARRFAERGYHPTSVAEVVQGMGVGKGVFYWYFSSKEELFLEILRDAQHDLRRRQQQAFGDEEDPIRRIELGIRATMGWLSENRHLFTLLQFATSEERFAPGLRRGQDVAVADVAKHVKEAIAAGRVRDADPTWLAHAIIGVTNQLARTFVFEKGEPPDMVADAWPAFCIDGLVGSVGRKSVVGVSLGRMIETLDDALKAVAQVAPVAREYCQKAEEARHLPVEVVDAIDEAGLWGVFAPKEVGGAGLMGLGEQFEIVRAIAYEDSSAGWSLFICGTSTALLAAKLADPARSEIFAGGTRPMAGVFSPGGSSQIVDGGVKVSGRWPFASGVGHAAYVMVNTILLDESGAPRPGVGGLPEIRSVVVPTEEVTLVDDWHVAGLRGTGSMSITMQEHFVPEQRTFAFFGGETATNELKYQVPLFTLLGPNFVGLAVGMAERALDEVIAVLPTRVGPPTFQPASGDPVNQSVVGRTAAAIRGAREASRSMYRAIDQRVENGENLADLSMKERAEHHTHNIWASGVCRDAVNDLFQLGGANSIYEPGILQRTWRDINVMNQHVFMRAVQYENAAKTLLDIEVNSPLV